MTELSSPVALLLSAALAAAAVALPLGVAAIFRRRPTVRLGVSLGMLVLVTAVTVAVLHLPASRILPWVPFHSVETKLLTNSVDRLAHKAAVNMSLELSWTPAFGGHCLVASGDPFGVGWASVPSASDCDISAFVGVNLTDVRLPDVTPVDPSEFHDRLPLIDVRPLIPFSPLYTVLYLCALAGLLASAGFIVKAHTASLVSSYAGDLRSFGSRVDSSALQGSAEEE